jgi:hypothetical protein
VVRAAAVQARAEVAIMQALAKNAPGASPLVASRGLSRRPWQRCLLRWKFQRQALSGPPNQTALRVLRCALAPARSRTRISFAHVCLACEMDCVAVRAQLVRCATSAQLRCPGASVPALNWTLRPLHACDNTDVGP